MAAVEGFSSLQEKLRAKAKEYKDASVTVGYTAGYSLHVHENLQMQHKPPTQAKFLEEPARVLDDDGTLKRIVTEALKQGKSLAQALLLAGLRLQRESQLLVPVRTGNLRASAFTRLDTGE